jgi:hypothetical protein
MERRFSIVFLYQIFTVFWLLIYVSTSLVIAWALLGSQETREKRRPGINIKEF